MSRKTESARWTTLRRWVQAGVMVLVVGIAAIHQTGGEGTHASVDAVCPFGGVETLWRLATTGLYVQRIQISALILLAGLVVATLVAGGFFCGWICPLGSIQDWIAALRKKLGVKEVQISEKWEKRLSFLRWVVLFTIIYATARTARLVFADYDPYRTIFSLHWLFEPSWSAWLGYAIAIVLLVAALFVNRLWCRFLCPFSPIIGLFGRLSILKVRRDDPSCTHCDLCDRKCPVKIKVSEKETMGSTCTSCLECVSACPTGSLSLTAGKSKEAAEQGKTAQR